MRHGVLASLCGVSRVRSHSGTCSLRGLRLDARRPRPRPWRSATRHARRLSRIDPAPWRSLSAARARSCRTAVVDVVCGPTPSTADATAHRRHRRPGRSISSARRGRHSSDPAARARGRTNRIGRDLSAARTRPEVRGGFGCRRAAGRGVSAAGAGSEDGSIESGPARAVRRANDPAFARAGVDRPPC